MSRRHVIVLHGPGIVNASRRLLQSAFAHGAVIANIGHIHLAASK